MTDAPLRPTSKYPLRELRMWVYDTRSPEFQAEARRQSALLAGAVDEREWDDLVERIHAEDGFGDGPK